VRRAVSAATSPPWLPKLLAYMRFCENGRNRHPNVPESAHSCEANQQHALNFGEAWTRRSDHMLSVKRPS
jgi:hypothetical protein